MNAVDALIFSKDRACQLDLLLSSMNEMVSGADDVTVIYKSSDAEFQAGYEICKANHTNVKFVEETEFRKNVFDWFLDNSRSESVMMLVDDIVFKEKVDYAIISQILAQNKQFLCYSPRLGLHLTECYAMNASQQVPNGNTQGGYFIWSWVDAPYDWGYMFSVDGHVFRKSEIFSWISHLNFHNPNTFEAAMQEIPRTFSIQGFSISHVISKLLNIPMNRVQNTFINRCENVSHVDLNRAFIDGKKLDSKRYAGILNRGCHASIDVMWR